MASLQVRELPDNIYTLLQKKAQKEHRSLAQEAVIILAKGLKTPVSPKERRAELLDKILNQASSQDSALLKLDPAQMVNEDRQR